MSNFLAPATVTAALKIALGNALTADDLGFEHTVVLGRPDDIETNGGGVNIYLYQATPNPSWRNADLPTRNGRGQLVQRPRAALDLYYLLTFFGNESSLQDQRLMGSVISTLHDQPLLTQAMIEAAKADDEFSDFLADSDLANEIERVKFTPISFNLEELSKLWSVFFQTAAYRLSTAYVASVVFIEREPEPGGALPIQTRTVTVVPTVDRERVITPDELPDLQLWLRSDTDVTYDNQGVSLWRDQSGNGHHAEKQNVAAQRPAFVAHGLDQHPILRFDGTDDRLAIQTLSYNSALNGITVCALVRANVGTAQIIVSFDGEQYWELGLSSNGLDPPTPLAQWRTTDTAANTHVLESTSALQDTRWAFICARFEAGATPNDKQLFIDGNLEAETAAHSGNALGGSTTRFGFIGAGSQADTFDGPVAAGSFFTSDVAEIVIYNRALTPAERDQLETYFAQRYA